MSFKPFKFQMRWMSAVSIALFALGCGKTNTTNSKSVGAASGTATAVLSYQTGGTGMPMSISWESASSVYKFEIQACQQGAACLVYVRVACSETQCQVSDVHGNRRTDIILYLSSNGKGGKSYRLQDYNYGTLGSGRYPVILAQ